MGEESARARVIVIGGGGFLGSRAVHALRQSAELDVVVASRRSDIRVDLSDASTFEALRGARLVIDLADATTSPPDALARWCLDNDVVMLETTSDFCAIDRLAKLPPGASDSGALILGAGIFTGLSNLVARKAAGRVGRANGVSLAIRSSPYSGAGPGTVALMAAILSVEAASFREGRRVTHPPVSRGPTVAFALGRAPSLRIPLAEVVMMYASIGAPSIDAYFSPKPSLLVLAFLAMPGLILRSAAFAAFMRAYFGFLRRFVLKGVTSTTELHAEAEGEAGEKASVDLRAGDGMTAGGVAIAAIALELVSKGAPRAGVSMVDDLVELDPVVARMKSLGGDDVVTVDLL